MKRYTSILACVAVGASIILISSVRSQEGALASRGEALEDRVRAFKHVLLEFDRSATEVLRMHLLTQSQMQWLRDQKTRAEYDSKLQSRPYSELSESQRRIANLKWYYLADVVSVGSDYVEIKLDSSDTSSTHLIPFHRINQVIVAEKPLGFDYIERS